LAVKSGEPEACEGDQWRIVTERATGGKELSAEKTLYAYLVEANHSLRTCSGANP
jgi:hypothetical protein